MISSDTILVRIIGDSKSGVAAANAQAASLERMGAAAKGATASMVSAGKAMHAVGTKTALVGHAMSRYISVPLLATGVAAVHMAADFDRSMTLLHTETGAGAKEVEKLRGQVLSLAKASRFGPKQLADAMYHVESSGIRGARAMELLTQASHLAAIGNAGVEETTRAMVSAFHSGIEEAGQFTKAAGIMNATIGAGNIRMAELVAAMGTGVLTSARQAGTSLSELGAILGSLTAQGIPAQVAATRLRMTFNLLIAPTEKAKKALEGIGLSQFDIAKKMNSPNGILKAIRLIKEHLKEAGGIYAQKGVLSEAFGGARSGTTVMAVINGYDEIRKKLAQIHENAKKVNYDFHVTEETSSYKLANAWSKLQVALVELGETIRPTIIPIIEDLTDGITAVTSAFDSLSPGMQEFIVKLGIAAVVGGPLLIFFGKLIQSTGIILELFGKFAGSLSMTTVAEGEAAAGATAIAASQAEMAAAVEASNVALAEQKLLIANSSGVVTGERAIAQTAATTVPATVEGAAAGAGAGAAASKKGWLAKLGLKSTPGGVVLPVTIAVVGAVALHKTAQKLGEKGGVGGTGIPGWAEMAATHIAGVGSPALAGYTLGNELTGGGLPGPGSARKEVVGTIHSTLQKPFREAMQQVRHDVLGGWSEINRDMQRAMAETGKQFAVGTTPWRKHTVEAMQAAVSTIRHGMKAGTIEVKEGQQHINKLLERIHMVQGRDPVGIAKGLFRSLQEGDHITDEGVRKIIRHFEKMPPKAREQGQNAILKMAEAWAKGHPKLEAQVDAMRQMIVGRFGKTNKALATAAVTAVENIGGIFSKLGDIVGGALGTIADEVNAALSAFGVAKTVHFATSTAGAAGKKAGDTVKGIAEDLGIATGGFVAGKKRRDHVHAVLGSEEAVLNVHQQPYVQQALAVSKAMGLSRYGSLGELFAGEQKPNHLAGGGFALPHQRVTGPQPLASIDQSGVNMVWKAASQFLAKQAGNRTYTAVVRNANRMDALHQPYLWGGGHGSVASRTGPWDCSGAVSELFNGAGWNFAPMVSSGFESWGLAGQGKVSVLANPEHVYAVIGDRAWGTSAENPGGGAGWIGGYTFRPGFTTRHADLIDVVSIGSGRKGKGQALKKGFAGGGFVFLEKGGIPAWMHGRDTLTPDQLATLANFVGAKNPGLMSQIAQAESGGDPKKMGGAGDKGLWQIIPSTAEGFGINYSRLFDPLENAKGMNIIAYTGGNGSAAQGLTAWTTYNTGAYRGHPKGRVNPNLIGGVAQKEEEVPERGHTTVRGGATGRGGGTSATEGKFGASYLTDKLSFGAVPSTLHECEQELRLRRQQLAHYRLALRGVKREHLPKAQHAIEVNIEALRRRIEELRAQKARLVAKAHKEMVARAITKRTEFEGITKAINKAVSDYELGNQVVDRIVALEPIDADERTMGRYRGVEIAAYSHVLDTELRERNTNITGILHGAQVQNKMTKEIEAIEALKGTHPQAYSKRKFRIPHLRKAIADIGTWIGERRDSLRDVQGIGGDESNIWGPGSLHAWGGHWLTLGGPGSQIFDTQKAILDALSPDITEDSKEDNSEALQLQREINRQLQENLEMHAADVGVFKEFLGSRMPFLGAFAKGGKIDLPLGQPGLAVLHGQETVIPAGASGGNVNIYLSGDLAPLIHAATPDMVKQTDQRLGRNARRISFAPGRS